MNKTGQKSVPLWIYRRSRTPDFVSVAMIIIGMLLLFGFYSDQPGLISEPFCMLLNSWFGWGAVFLAILIIVLGIAILVLRWFVPRLDLPIKIIQKNVVLLLIVFFTWLILLGLSDEPKRGGRLGIGLAICLEFVMPKLLAKMVMFLFFIASLLCLAQVKRWGPLLVRNVKTYFDSRRCKEDDLDKGISIDWQKEIIRNNAKGIQKEESPRFEEPENEMSSETEPAEESEPLAVEPKTPEELIPTMRHVAVYMSDYRDQINKEKEEKEKMSEKILRDRQEQLPPLNLLDAELGFYGQNTDHRDFINELESSMEEFGVPVTVIGCEIGPSVIQYQVVPGKNQEGVMEGDIPMKNVRVKQVEQIERDLAVRLGISNLTIQAPVPGKNYIGIDIPNPNVMKVRLRPLMESPEFRDKQNPLNVVLGRDITGKPVVVNLGEMPHLLVAGTTNSGKSICLRSMAVCLAMNNTPDRVRMVMIDPKRVELFRFNGIPHLLGKVETEYERAIAVLEWAVIEMNNRTELFQSVGVRSLASYNKYAAAQGIKGLPYIVIFIDEMAEIMKGPDKQGQKCVDLLASLARAAGIHLVTATQRPDTSVITGKIKTNIPARIALKVASAIDSRVIMDRQGAEKLLGRGDMYFIAPSVSAPRRLQGALLTDREIDKVVGLWKKLYQKSDDEEKAPWEEVLEGSKDAERSKDEKKLRDAILLVCRTKKASAAYLSGKLNVSSPTASRLIGHMEEMGVVGPMQLGGKVREVFWSEEEAKEYASRRNEKPDFYDED